MINISHYEVWLVTGSQHLYGPETLEQVTKHSQEIAQFLNAEKTIPVKVLHKPTVKTPDEIYRLCMEANNTEKCVGLVTWMHTFSPAKMWIAGLKALQKPGNEIFIASARDRP